MTTARRPTLVDPVDASERLHTPAALANREPILAALRTLLVPGQTVLEIASGTGLHAAYFAANLPGVRWRPSDPDPAMRRSILAWSSEQGAPSDPPLALDVLASGWWDGVEGPVDAVFCANMLHVAPPEAMDGLLTGCGRILADGGPLALYGPFTFNGSHIGQGNLQFDRMLRGQNPAWGLRDLNDIAARGAAAGLALDRVIDMPANNHIIVLRRP